MESFHTLTIVLIVLGIIGIALLIGGIILLINGIINTVRKTKRIGRIVGGAIMTFFALTLIVFAGCFLIVDKSSIDIASDPSTIKMYGELNAALETNNEKALAETFAYQTFSGDKLELKDAEEFFESLGSDIDRIETRIHGVGYHNDTSTIEYLYEITTEDDDEYTAVVICIIDSKFDEYEGVQYIRVREGKTLICEIGEKPMFD